MKRAELAERTSFSQEEILAIAHGTLVEDAEEELPRLPTPPMLMLDRVVELTRGTRGRIVAELDVRPDAWYFQCHFRGDPVQPGCLGVDGVWQLLGVYMLACGSAGQGRALGCKEIDFFGQIRPFDKLVRYEIEVRRYARLKESGATITVGDAVVLVDGQAVYRVTGAKAGLFPGIAYPDYPRRSKNSTGGVMDR